MDQSRILVGMKVKIIGIKVTHKRHNSCIEMKKMVGRVYKVTKIRRAEEFSTSFCNESLDNIKCITVEDNNHDFVWAPEDLQYARPKFELPKVVIFNPDNIVRI